MKNSFLSFFANGSRIKMNLVITDPRKEEQRLKNICSHFIKQFRAVRQGVGRKGEREER
jgi:hypothetical protein